VALESSDQKDLKINKILGLMKDSVSARQTLSADDT